MIDPKDYQRLRNEAIKEVQDEKDTRTRLEAQHVIDQAERTMRTGKSALPIDRSYSWNHKYCAKIIRTANNTLIPAGFYLHINNITTNWIHLNILIIPSWASKLLLWCNKVGL